jgi:hypothetical protein
MWPERVLDRGENVRRFEPLGNAQVNPEQLPRRRKGRHPRSYGAASGAARREPLRGHWGGVVGVDDANQRLQVVVRSDAAVKYGLEDGIFPVIVVEFTT